MQNCVKEGKLLTIRQNKVNAQVTYYIINIYIDVGAQSCVLSVEGEDENSLFLAK